MCPHFTGRAGGADNCGTGSAPIFALGLKSSSGIRNRGCGLADTITCPQARRGERLCVSFSALPLGLPGAPVLPQVGSARRGPAPPHGGADCQGGCGPPRWSAACLCTRSSPHRPRSPGEKAGLGSRSGCARRWQTLTPVPCGCQRVRGGSAVCLGGRRDRRESLS